jgi:seryl-tRNA(Sec) selenium transferase
MTIEDADAIKQEMGRLRRRLRDLDAERTDLEVTLAALERQQSALDRPARSLPSEGATVTTNSPASEKIALFRGLSSLSTIWMPPYRSWHEWPQSGGPDTALSAT